MTNKFKVTCWTCCALLVLTLAGFSRQIGSREPEVTAIPLLILREASGINAVALSPDGQLAAAASGLLDGNRIKLWDCRRKKILHVLDGHRSFVLKMAFTADGARLVTISYDAVHVWNVADAARLHTMPGRINFASSHALDADRGRLATVDTASDVVLWDLTAGVRRILLPRRLDLERFVSLAFTPDGRSLACGTFNGEIVLWDLARDRIRAVLRGPEAPVLNLAGAPDGTQLASSGNRDDLTIRIWDLESYRSRTEWHTPAAWIQGTAFSPDGTVLASSHGDGTARLWNPRSGELRGILGGHTDRVAAVAFSADGRHFITRGIDGSARLWKVAGLVP